MKVFKALFNFFSSYGLACALFVLLLVLTFLGTLEQTEHGIYDVQKRYFESIYVVHWMFGVPLPLPGGGLLLTLLAVNITLGGIIRARKTGWRHIGVFIGHLGIVLLLLAGFIKYAYGIDGYMSLYPGEQSNQFESYSEWQLAVWKTGEPPITEYIIPQEQFRHAAVDAPVTHSGADLPFDLRVDRYYRNSMPAPSTAVAQAPTPIVDGFFLQPMEKAQAVEQNVPGVYLTVLGPEEEREALLFGLQNQPYAFRVGDDVWAVDLRRKRWQTPFALRLEEFIKEEHPGTNIPSTFRSEAIKIEEGAEQSVSIRMNEPLRHEGYTFYQASWGPQNAPPGAPLFSTFAVARDPAEKLPLIACIVITIGLALHFVVMLGGYLRQESQRRHTAERS